MRLIDADALLKHRTDHDMISTHLIYNAPTVEAIPVSFINEQIEKLQGIADYEFIESGGYLGECNHELRALQDLLKHFVLRLSCATDSSYLYQL